MREERWNEVRAGNQLGAHRASGGFQGPRPHLVVPEQPHPRRLVVLVVRDHAVVRPHLHELVRPFDAGQGGAGGGHGRESACACSRPSTRRCLERGEGRGQRTGSSEVQAAPRPRRPRPPRPVPPLRRRRRPCRGCRPGQGRRLGPLLRRRQRGTCARGRTRRRRGERTRARRRRRGRGCRRWWGPRSSSWGLRARGWHLVVSEVRSGGHAGNRGERLPCALVWVATHSSPSSASSSPSAKAMSISAYSSPGAPPACWPSWETRRRQGTGCACVRACGGAGVSGRQWR